jgi:phage tail-like protein
MKSLRPRSFRFATTEQWRACLFDRIELPAGEVAGLALMAPFDSTPVLHSARGARAPAVSISREIFWVDETGHLHRIDCCDGSSRRQMAPYAIATAARLVPIGESLNVLDASWTTIVRFEASTLARLSTTELGARAVDIAGDGDELFALMASGCAARILPIDCGGRIGAAIDLDQIEAPRALVYLRRKRRFVVLTGGDDPHLLWFDAAGGAPLCRKRVAAIRPCFAARALGGDSRDRVLLAGADAAHGERSTVLMFDGDGAQLGATEIDALDSPVAGVTATRDALFVAGRRGLLKFARASWVPDGTAEISGALVTSLLQSPEVHELRRWLRVEVTARLPAGSTLEISYVATADPALRDRMLAIAADETLTAGARLQKFVAEPGAWSNSVLFHGGDGPESRVLSLPLHAVREPWLWVHARLAAVAGAALPVLSQLSVLYPGQSLVDYLPAIYRRENAGDGGFVRSLAGLLESTTQQFDEIIASLASQIHPETARGPWLDYIARWLEMPWDDALDEGQKQRIVARAAELARLRGTRAGLETLLECLMPEVPRRFRIIDAGADFGFATIGGPGCRGSALPAILGGRTPWSSELDASAILGQLRLPCSGEVDDGVRHLAGRVRVEVAASAAERIAWEPWLAALIREGLPLSARLTLRWTAPRAFNSNTLDGSLVLEAPPTPHLGSDAVVGIARLPNRGVRIAATGADPSTRLQ